MTDPSILQLAPELTSRLEAMALDMRRDPAEVACMAIEAYIEANAWQVRHIRKALDEDQAGTPGVPHEEVVKRMRSWGTEHELSRQRPKP